MAASRSGQKSRIAVAKPSNSGSRTRESIRHHERSGDDALRHFYTRPLENPAGLKTSELRTLIAASNFTEGHAPFVYDRDDLRRILAKLSRMEEYACVVSPGVYGRDAELALIVYFLSEKAPPERNTTSRSFKSLDRAASANRH
jgi:hypothetical protein